MRLGTERRIYEILPGASVWLTLGVAIVCSFLRPLWVIYGVILFDLYWLFRVTYYLPFLLISWRRYKRDLHTDWQTKARQCAGYDHIRHLVFLPTYKEELPVVRETIERLASSAMPSDRILIVLAGEERDRERFERNAAALREEFGVKFGAFWTTQHPKDLPDEIPGKGSNLHWAGHEVLPKIQAMGIEIEHVIVSSFDVDTLIHPQYLSAVTHAYLTVPDPTKSSYQPVPLYNNNLWESPAAVRVAMFGTTFWLLTELSRPEQMMTFSSHSMSLRMLVDVGFWQKDVVSEDSRIFLQGLIRYHGEYRVTPIYVPVSMDTVMTGKYWQALRALYAQIRRWAWGVENFPYMAMAFRRDPLMPRRVKWKYLWKQMEGMFTWATAPLLIFFMGRLPFWLASDALREIAIVQNAPFTLQWIMRFAMVGVFVTAGLALTLLPPRPAHVSRPYAALVTLFQWALLPVTFVLFGAIPAIDAQTRLMLGKPLGFRVSPKRISST